MTGVADLDRIVTQLTPAVARDRSRAPAYKNLADGLRGMILDGHLVVGDQLPPQRTLAAALELSRTTVVTSLTQLRAEGYLSSRQGSATTVQLPAEHTDRPDETGAGGRPEIDLSIAVLPAPGQVATAAARAVERLPEFLAGPGLHPLGLPLLRSAVASRLTERGLATSADQVMITQGALHGWDLVLRTFSRPGGSVVLEQPSYPAAIDAVRAHRARAQPVAVSAEGWHWPTRSLQSVDVAYLVPDFQNPTGHFAPEAERRQLARRLRGTLICIDETFAELGDTDSPTSLPTACFVRDALTIGSLSKIAWAGLRIGWLRGPRDTVRRIATARSSQDVAAPVLEQLLAFELMQHLDAVRDDRRVMLHRRRKHAVSTIRRAGWQVTEPGGGMFLWVDLKGLSSSHLSAAVRAHGVRVPPGTRFSTSGTHDRFLRLPFTTTSDQLSEAVHRMVHATTGQVVAPGDPTTIWTV